MESLSLESSFNINNGSLISIEELKSIYLFGIPVKDINTGSSLSDQAFQFAIDSATEQLEAYLELKFKKQVFKENFQFNEVDWGDYGYVKTTFPVVCPYSLTGFLNTVKQVIYPRDWLTSKKTLDNRLYQRRINVVPAGHATQTSMAAVFTGTYPNFGYLNQGKIPDYWDVEYVTGFDVIPKDIIAIIGSFAALSIFNISGDLIMSPGIGSFSLSIDGLSQSQSAKAFDQRIQRMYNELKDRLLPNAKDVYKGYTLTVC